MTLYPTTTLLLKPLRGAKKGLKIDSGGVLEVAIFVVELRGATGKL